MKRNTIVAALLLLAGAAGLAPPARAEDGDRPAIRAAKPEGVRFGERRGGPGGGGGPAILPGETARVSGKISKVSGGELWLGAKRFRLTAQTAILSSDGRRIGVKSLAKDRSVTVEAVPGRGGVPAAKQVQLMEEPEEEREKFL